MQTVNIPGLSDGASDRIITITDEHETWEMSFYSPLIKDSRALHHLLCYVDPGDEYTVSFKNKEN